MDQVRGGTPQVIIHNSEASIIVIKFDDLKKMEEANKPAKKARKFDLEYIRKNSIFEKYRGCLDSVYDPKISSVELCKRWGEYVD